ncbi:hypothetical protein LTR37_009781 [Vermiconidia calcicola]|uniref:Uncharacterized protein n=1 Tax=Vermiconidia calcicola TaxID=1690605 RepID=A0ACC3N6V4_9PEZI|nr:hypothetical protein LTR37_009781 [Vermiconidia calcicola]
MDTSTPNLLEHQQYYCDTTPATLALMEVEHSKMASFTYSTTPSSTPFTFTATPPAVTFFEVGRAIVVAQAQALQPWDDDYSEGWSAQPSYYSDATPANIEGMIGQFDRMLVSGGASNCALSQTSYPTTFRFFDLPRELRDAIYGYVLVPETPIEFAPWIGCDHEWDYEDWWLKLGDDADDYSNWHWRRWNNIIRPSLALLRVCRQMHVEGSSIYYGQPFRFSSDT